MEVEEKKVEVEEKKVEEDDEDGLDVTIVEHNGKEYYHDESDDMIYDPESGDEVGKMVDGKVVLD